MNKDEALRMALEALKNAYWPTESDLMPAHNIKECGEAITTLKEYLAQPEQEPVAWTVEGQVRDWSKDFSAYRTQHYVRPVYTTPPQRKPLTDEMVRQCKLSCDTYEMRGAFVDGWTSAEQAHGIKE